MDDIIPLVNIKGRDYRFYASGGTLFRINDNTTPYMAMLVRTFPAEVNKALGSLGWYLRDKVREAIRAEGPGGGWAKHAGIGKIHIRGDRAWRTRAANPHSGLFGHLYMAVGYRRDKANMRVQIGFLSKRSAGLAAKLQEGFSTPVTDKMRRLYSLHGIKLRAKGTITTPARPLIAPVYQEVQGEIVPYIEGKILDYIHRTKPSHVAA